MLKKILVADDNPNIRQTLYDILTEKGYQVDTASDGYEVLSYLKEKNAHILVLDLIMPYKNGVEILSTIKNIAPYIRIIIYTAFKEYENLMYTKEADKFIPCFIKRITISACPFLAAILKALITLGWFISTKFSTRMVCSSSV